jgi:hypothetical protein
MGTNSLFRMMRPWHPLPLVISTLAFGSGGCEGLSTYPKDIAGETDYADTDDDPVEDSDLGTPNMIDRYECCANCQLVAVVRGVCPAMPSDVNTGCTNDYPNGSGSDFGSGTCRTIDGGRVCTFNFFPPSMQQHRCGSLCEVQDENEPLEDGDTDTDTDTDTDPQVDTDTDVGVDTDTHPVFGCGEDDAPESLV